VPPRRSRQFLTNNRDGDGHWFVPNFVGACPADLQRLSKRNSAMLVQHVLSLLKMWQLLVSGLTRRATYSKERIK
jgi:hypothetical protein